MPPPTPLFAGNPVRYSHSPEKSYMPQVAITERTFSTYSSGTARMPVTGLTPPLASVAPISARSRQVTRIAHCRK